MHVQIKCFNSETKGTKSFFFSVSHSTVNQFKNNESRKTAVCLVVLPVGRVNRNKSVLCGLNARLPLSNFLFLDIFLCSFYFSPVSCSRFLRLTHLFLKFLFLSFFFFIPSFYLESPALLLIDHRRDSIGRVLPRDLTVL